MMTALLATALAVNPAHFYGQCTFVNPEGEVYWSACELQDLPAAGFRNRWHVLVDIPELREGMTVDWIKAQARDSGLIFQSLLWGRLFVLPDEPELQKHFNQSAPAFEIRPQQVTVRPYAERPGWTEILFEEPENGEPDARPNATWLRRQEASWRARGRAK